VHPIRAPGFKRLRAGLDFLRFQKTGDRSKVSRQVELVGVRRDLVMTSGGGKQSRARGDVGNGEAARSAAYWGVTKAESHKFMVALVCRERDPLNAGGGGVAAEREPSERT
jgi:hypothetical protein